MSYSFLASGPTKTDAILDAESKFDKVCVDMPIHEKDKDAVLSHLRNMVNLLPEADTGEVVSVSMNGYISTLDGRITTVSAHCSASVSKVA